MGFVFLAASGVAKYTMEIVGNVGQNGGEAEQKQIHGSIMGANRNEAYGVS